MRALGARRVRSALALAGAATGVAAVVLTAAVGVGTARRIDEQIQSLGANLLIVRPADVKRLVARQALSGPATTLTLDDFAAVGALRGVAHAAPGVSATMTVKHDATTTSTTVLGTTPAFAAVRRFHVRTGRLFDDDDDRHARRVAVLGAEVADALFAGAVAVGQAIRIRGVPFDVIGVLAPKGVLADGDEDNQILIPFHTAARRVFNVTWLSSVFVSVVNPTEVSSVETRIEALLGARHRSERDVADDFEVQDAARYFTIQRKASETLRVLTAGIAAVALGVGGTGIMALMLLSIRERSDEIGLRVAVGARPRDIVAQFLMESTALVVAGWLGGVAVALFGGIAIARATSLAIAPPLAALAGSFAMVMIIGIGFGAFPARRASLLPPIRAMAER